MQMPSEGTSSEVLLDSYGEYHLAALGAEPRAASLRADFAARQQALRDALAARQAAGRSAQAAEALKVRAEQNLEDVLREFELGLLAAVGKRRERDPYKRVFPKNLLGALEPVGLAQVAEARRIADLLAPATGSPIEGVPPTLAPVVARLRQAADELERTVAADVAAERAYQTAFANELAERRRWREQYRKNHGLLLAMFADTPRKADTFFRREKTRKKVKAGSGAPVQPA
jgi:hypothetical protein